MQFGPTSGNARSAPERLIHTLGAEVGPRPATSTAEARAAALVAAQMRQQGLEVGVQTFSAAQVPTVGLGLLAAMGVVATLLGVWLPLPSLLLGLTLLWLAWRELRGPPTLAALLGLRPSQNVIGSRAADGAPRWRVVLLCHLDSPRAIPERWQMYLRWRLLAVPLGLLLLNLVLGLHWLHSVDRMLLSAPGLILSSAAVITVLRQRSARWTAGAVDAAGVAAALGCVAQTQDLDNLEVWMVALGAGAAAGAGLQALLESYPFPQEDTWFINVPWVGRGILTLVAGEGLWRELPPDAALVKLFHELRSMSAPLDRKAYRGERLDSARLLKRGYHAVSLVGLNTNGTAAGFRRTDDQVEQIDLNQVTVATTLLCRALQRLNELAPHELLEP